MTNGDKINSGTPPQPQILIAPLDWGLGHATRCIPIIKLFQSRGWNVILAASGKPALLLAKEFPNMELLPLRGYELQYSTQGKHLKWKILRQLPRILTCINSENRWLATLLSQRRIDMVISDCRFGLHNSKAFCVFMTHQLTIRSPFGRWMEGWLRKWNYSFINKFNECWVPDFQHSPNLAGEISHPPVMPTVPVKYIGGLSRFTPVPQQPGNTQFEFLVILSGPEPQRTIFEKMVLKEITAYEGRAALVRGLPDEANELHLPGIPVFNHLPANELCALMMKSSLIISRSGYTTVMDLVKLRKKSVLVPTPGQTEQEYLGKYLMLHHWCVCMHQKAFSLATALDQAAKFLYGDMGRFDLELYQDRVAEGLRGMG